MNTISKEILLSIICRSYNGEKYIYSALLSLAKNLDDRCEVVIVDNGSNDGTINIIKNFLSTEKYSFKINFIQQENSGPGGSSNSGLNNASGKFVGFLDCDDVYLETFSSNILKILEKEQIDILEYGYILFSDQKKIDHKNYKSLYKNLSGKYLTNSILETIFAKTNWYPFTRIIKKDLWFNIRFPLNKAYEDDMTMYKLFLKSKSIYMLNQPAMGYRLHPSSITSKHTTKQLFDLIDFYWKIDMELIYKNIFKLRLARTISYFIHELNLGKNEYKKILNDQKKIKFSLKKILYFKKADIFYYLFPRLYNFINYVRFRMRK